MEFSDADDYDDLENEINAFSSMSNYSHNAYGNDFDSGNPEIDLKRASILSTSPQAYQNNQQVNEIQQDTIDKSLSQECEIPLVMNTPSIPPHIKQLSPLGEKLAALTARFDSTHKQIKSPEQVPALSVALSSGPIKIIHQQSEKIQNGEQDHIKKKQLSLTEKYQQQMINQIDRKQLLPTGQITQPSNQPPLSPELQNSNRTVEIEFLNDNLGKSQILSPVGQPVDSSQLHSPFGQLDTQYQAKPKQQPNMQKQKHENTLDDIPYLPLDRIPFPVFSIDSRIKYPERDEHLLDKITLNINYAEFARSCKNDVEKWKYDFKVEYRVINGEIIPNPVSSDFVDLTNIIKAPQSGLPKGCCRITRK
ncbi:hypothetical protein SS50377_25358 [Spironucleus salmonicida]|uniref:Uncharacterized protein n=1 Tax=Spironucleus salmonicida TaxID=348837 RepID=V6LBD9_9EUKA|nr:hypothetical protein SS50377_25358 [Spironucleus salmonicida]|eukprot:EST41765.1 Hypothetical protein SS50377_18598 [Spironucleus salmonicida]